MMWGMADWFLETGLFLLGIALIPADGLLFICWGLWGDRSNGRSRCPKCWYDMRGSPPTPVRPRAADSGDYWCFVQVTRRPPTRGEQYSDAAPFSWPPGRSAV